MTGTELLDLPEALQLLMLERVSGMSGSLGFLLTNRRWSELSPEVVVSARVRSRAGLTPTALAKALEELPSIRSLVIQMRSVSTVSDELLTALGSACPRLQSLIFEQGACHPPSACSVSATGFDALFSACPDLRHLVLRACNSVGLPDSLSNLTDLETLQLLPINGNSAYLDTLALPAAAGEALQRLQRLSFIGSVLTLPPAILHLRGLEDLVLQCRAIRELPKEFGALSCLARLSLICPWLTSLPESFGNLWALQQLSIRGTMMQELPESFGSLSALEQLQLQDQHLQALPESFGELKKLQSLTLIKCKNLVQLPRTFGLLVQLQLLRITHCESFAALPDSFGELPSLAKLEISFCEQLEDLSPSLGDLPKLRTLHLCGLRSLRSLPSLGPLPALGSLDIVSCSSLTELSWPPGSWQRLERLSLCSLSSLRTLSGSWAALSSLVELDITGCESLTVLPDTLPSLPCLQQMSITSCGSLSSLPSMLGSLSSVRSLRLTSCPALMELPDSLCAMEALEVLDIKECPALAGLPEGFGKGGNPPALKHLVLAGLARMVTLPPFFGDLPLLCEVRIAKCHSLERLPEGFGALRSLRACTVEDCARFKTFHSLPRGATLHVMGHCPEFHDSERLKGAPLLDVVPGGRGLLVRMRAEPEQPS